MQKLDIEVKLGEHLELELALSSDEAGEIPLPAGWTYAVVLHGYDLGEDPPLELTEGEGFAKTATSTILVDQAITATQFTVGLGHWYVRAIDPEGRAFFPLGGKLVVGNP